MEIDATLKELEQLRVSRNWSERRMARELGVSPACYHFWLKGSRRPSPLARRAIAEFLSKKGAEMKSKVKLERETCQTLFCRFHGWLPFRSHMFVFDTETGKCRIVKQIAEGAPPREEIPFPEVSPILPEDVVDRLWWEHETWGDAFSGAEVEEAEEGPPPRFVRVPYLAEAIPPHPRLPRAKALKRAKMVRKRALRACRAWLAKLGEERGIQYIYDPRDFTIPGESGSR